MILENKQKRGVPQTVFSAKHSCIGANCLLCLAQGLDPTKLGLKTREQMIAEGYAECAKCKKVIRIPKEHRVDRKGRKQYSIWYCSLECMHD